MRKIDSRIEDDETLDMLNITPGRFYFHSDYSCNNQCGGCHPHITIEEFRAGDRKEVWSEEAQNMVLRTVVTPHFQVRGQSLRAGIHCSGMEFCFRIATMEEAEQAIQNFTDRKL